MTRPRLPRTQASDASELSRRVYDLERKMDPNDTGVETVNTTGNPLVFPGGYVQDSASGEGDLVEVSNPEIATVTITAGTWLIQAWAKFDNVATDGLSCNLNVFKTGTSPDPHQIDEVPYTLGVPALMAYNHCHVSVLMSEVLTAGTWEAWAVIRTSGVTSFGQGPQYSRNVWLEAARLGFDPLI